MVGPRAKNEAGISLVEVMVALTILSVVLISLGGLMFHVARQARMSAASTYRAAAVQRASAWVESLPWDSLAPAGPAVGCEAGVSGPMTYDRCVTIVDQTPYMRRVNVVISPTGALAVQPDTLEVLRNRRRQASFIQ